ncbi:hypothetical protein BX070DRAFT_231173 [Coemansia spiralis]|nr:hypothetical protein BX070DRAFT_231173 [Coemansia spiralis]
MTSNRPTLKTPICSACNRVSFGGKITHDPQCSFVKAVEQGKEITAREKANEHERENK